MSTRAPVRERPRRVGSAGANRRRVRRGRGPDVTRFGDDATRLRDGRVAAVRYSDRPSLRDNDFGGSSSRLDPHSPAEGPRAGRQSARSELLYDSTVRALPSHDAALSALSLSRCLAASRRSVARAALASAARCRRGTARRRGDAFGGGVAPPGGRRRTVPAGPKTSRGGRRTPLAVVPREGAAQYECASDICRSGAQARLPRTDVMNLLWAARSSAGQSQDA